MRYIVFCFLIGATLLLQAQQPAQYSLFMLNPQQWNPAFAGMDYSLVATAGYRKQWAQLPGSPQGQYISVQAPAALIGGGWGIQLENDRLGAGRWTAAQVHYSHHRVLGNSVLAMGVAAGLLQRVIDGAQIRTPDGVYEPGASPNHNDPQLPSSIEAGSTPVLHAGAFFRSASLDAGVGVRHLVANRISLPSFSQPLTRTFFLQLGMQFGLGRKLLLAPALLVQTDMIQTQTNVAARFNFQDNFFLGAGFRGYSGDTQDALVLMGGVKISNNLSLNYAYDMIVSGLQPVNTGSHEIVLQYNLNKPIGRGRLPNIIYNPRTL